MDRLKKEIDYFDSLINNSAPMELSVLNKLYSQMNKAAFELIDVRQRSNDLMQEVIRKERLHKELRADHAMLLSKFKLLLPRRSLQI